jgi:hypothetical protein
MNNFKNNKQLLFSGAIVMAFVLLAIQAAKSTTFDQLTLKDSSLAAGNASNAKGKNRPTSTPVSSPGTTPIVVPTITPIATPDSTLPPISGTTIYVSPTGSDTNNGSEAAPLKSIAKALSAVNPGGAVIARGGEYIQRVTGMSIKSGTASAPIRFAAYPGERPVIKGLLWLSAANYWSVDGINVTWDSNTGVASEHMVKFSGGTNWTYANSEVWGAHSFAGILVSGGAANWKMNNLNVHDTYLSNDVNQDHLVYVSNASFGVIEHSQFINSPNGRGIKLGPPSATSEGPNNIIIRYNTFYNNLGPANVQLSYGSHDNSVYRNIFQKPGSGQTNVTANTLTGTNNLVFDNVGWESNGVVEKVANLTDKGGNIYVDPQFVSIANRDLHPLNPEVQLYGAYTQ